MKISSHLFSKLVTCVTLLLALGSCSGGGSGGGSTTAGSATLTINSPAQGATLPVGPALVTFNIQNSPVPPSDTQPRMHFYVDGDTTPYKFYEGPGIGEEGSSSGVRYKNVHTHFVHWKSATSFAIAGLSSAGHQVRLILTNANDLELTNSQATKILNFSVSTPPTGELRLEPVLGGLKAPVGLSLAPDGRVFYNERLTGDIRIIDPGWPPNPKLFCHIPVATFGFEQGLLGLTLDPNFANNHYVYVYYTVPNAAMTAATMNRVVRYTESSGQCVSETLILGNIPSANNHNGGIIQFGPDGMLYVITGDAESSGASAVLTSLAGKILRVNPDGTVPVDNPFSSSSNANEQKVFSFGHRNSYGFTFHPHTGHLWETENGDSNNDEINRIIKGGNYGWDGTQRMGVLNAPPLIDPIAVFFAPPCGPCVIAPTGIIAIPENSTVYPIDYRNNLFFVDYLFGQMRRLILTGPDLTELGSSSIAYPGGEGGLISLMIGADGFVYVSNLGTDPDFLDAKIFRVVPN